MNYPEFLGQCFSNFNSLELLIRVYLVKQNKEIEVGLEVDEGNWVPVTFMTNYMQFRILINEYNKISNEKIPQKYVDDIVRFRDLIAHGRMSSLSESFPLTAVKYSDEKNGMVKVVVKQCLSVEYLNDIKDKINNCINLVLNGIKAIK